VYNAWGNVDNFLNFIQDFSHFFPSVSRSRCKNLNNTTFSKICILQQAHEKHQILSASAEIISIVQTKINSAQLVNTKFVKIVNYVRYINTSFLQRLRHFAENSSVSISEILLILNSLILDNIIENSTMDNVHSAVRCWHFFFFATYLLPRLFFWTRMLQQQRYL